MCILIYFIYINTLYSLYAPTIPSTVTGFRDRPPARRKGWMGMVFYLEGHKHIITFTGTQIALILSQTGQATVASCPGPSVWLLQTSVAITSLIPFYEILFYPITNLIQEWLAKREWMAATPRWTSGSSKASNGSSMSCRRNPRGGKMGSLEEQHLVNT